VANTIRIKRSTGSSAPGSLANAELAYAEGSNILYYGTGTGGAGGSATSIEAIGGDGYYSTLSTAQTLTSDGGTYTFHAKGSFGISKAIGLFISKPIIKAVIPKTSTVSHAIRSVAGTATAGSDATLALDATYGIGKTASISGPGLTSGLTVSSISAGSPSTSNGTIEMSSAQNLSGLEGSGAGFVVNFGDFVTQINITINFNILSPGLNDRTITLLLDNFITPGVGS